MYHNFYLSHLRCQKTVTKGFSLVEIILGSALFALLIPVFVGALIYSGETAVLSGKRAQAVFFAEEGLEAVRNIRDEDFSLLVDGVHGLSISGGEWTLSGTSDTNGIFTRFVTISSIDADRKQASSEIIWQQNNQRTGSVSYSTRLTNWRKFVGSQSDSLVVDASGAFLGGGEKHLQGITLENVGGIDITIDKITVSWTNTPMMSEIRIGGVKVWSKSGPGTPTGEQSSGTVIDIQDYILIQGSGIINIDRFKFDGTMGGAVFTIVFTLGDGSTETLSNLQM